jgi:uncharacterized protein (DUF1800 family)
MIVVNDRDAIIWLHRRAGFGLGAQQLTEAVSRGPDAELERLLDPTAAGAPPTTDMWDDAKLPLEVKDKPSRLYAIDTWLDSMVATAQPVVDRLAWLWHGHFVSGLDKVKVGKLMVDQVRLFRREGLGSFTTLLHDVTIDPAMMLYLDLRTSTGSLPNENYAREVMELFTLGVGNYAEADVHAGAVALTGWTLPQRTQAQFVPRRHDDSPQTYLGVGGVHDVDSVVGAITAQPAMATFIARTVALELLGAAPDDLVAELATTFTSSGLDIRGLVRATLRAGLAGAGAPIVLGPVLWLVMAQRVTGVALAAGTPKSSRRAKLLRDAGQLPMLPPNVAGWPGGAAWFGSGSLVARTNLAVLVAADAAGDSAALAAARGNDVGALAAALSLPDAGFGTATARALAAAPAGAQRLALALVSPEFTIV